MMKRIGFLFILMFCLGAGNGFGANFYLSTEKSYMDSESAQIKIESRNIGEAKIRLYKVPDPKSFIRSRRNINRVYIESEYIQSNPSELLVRYGNTFKNSLKDFGKGIIRNYDAREGAKDNLEGVLGYKYPRSRIEVGRNKDFEFVREFSQELSGESSWTYAYIDFGKLSPGLYLSEVYTSSEIAYSLVHVSKVAMLIKKSESRLLIQTLDKKTGNPVKANVTIYDFTDGKELKKAYTGDNGILDYTFRKNKYSEFLVYAETANDFTFYKVSLYPSAEVERVVYIYTDSPIYKPGQSVHIKGVIRDFVNSLYKVPNVNNIKVSVVDPRGNNTELNASGVSDYGSFTSDYDLGENSATGMYKIIATADGKTYMGEFKVQNYVKPKFKVTVSSPVKTTVKDETVNFTVKAQYYTGNRVKSGNLTYSIFKTPAREDILETEKDIFEDPAYASKVEFVDSKKVTLDSNGEFSGSFKPANYGVDRDYVFIVKAEVVDDSYARANGQVKVKVAKNEFMMQARVGKAVYEPEEKVQVTVKMVYADGGAVRNKEVRYKATLENDKTDVAEGRVQTDNAGYATVSFRAKGGGFLKIALSARDKYGNEVNENVYTWIGKDGATFVYTSGDITIVFDRKEYKVGDTAKVLIVSPVSFAQALVTTEREDIFQTYFKKFSGNTVLMEVPIQREYAPNFFFSVVFIFNNQIYENTVKVKVPPVERVLSLDIIPDKKTYGPRESGKVKIVVKNSDGKAEQAEVSVAIVNEALYSISSEIAPDPRLFFYSYRWNSVSSLNSIALRFYGYSRELRQRYAMRYYDKKIWEFEDTMNGSGGSYAGRKDSRSEDSSEEFVRKEFKDQIVWVGKVVTDRNGTATVDVTFPDNLTEWRIVALAVTKDTRVGKDSATVKTAREIFVRLNIPRNLTYVDKGLGFATVVNNTDSLQKVSLDMKFKDIKSDFSAKTLTIMPRAEETVEFRLEPYQVAAAKLTVSAKSSSGSDTMEQTIDVLPVSLKKVYSEVRVVKSASDSLTLNVPAGAIPETIRATVGLSEMDNPFGVVAEALPYLKQYPYGCVEQTTSSFLPNLVAFEVSKKLKMSLPGQFEDKDKIMEEGLKKLYGYQNSSGGWGWWSENQADTYMTAYVLYALNFVRRTYPDKLDNNVFYRGINALKTAAYNEKNNLTRIYAYYVLAQCGYYYKDMIQRMAKENVSSPYYLALLTLTAQYSGLTTLAGELAEKLDGLKANESLGVSWSSSGDDYWYGDRIIGTSVAVRALMAVSPKSANIERGIIYLLSARQGSYWYCTRSTAEAIYAISEYAANGYVKGGGGNVALNLNNKSLGSMTFSGSKYKNTIELTSSDLQPGKNYSLKFGANSGTYIASVILEYHTRDLTIQGEDQGIAVKRNYYKIEDKRRKVKLEGNASLAVGDVILVEMEASSRKGLDYVVIEDAIPSGFLPVYEVNEYNVGVNFFDKTTHYEFGKDKASFFFKNFYSGKYYYVLQATYPGIYYSTPTLAYAMYQPENRGNGSSGLIEVRKK